MLPNTTGPHPLCETRSLLIEQIAQHRCVTTLSDVETLRENASQVVRRKRQHQFMLARLRAIGPEPLCLLHNILENNPLGLREAPHQQPRSVPGAVQHDAPKDPLQFGNAILLSPEVRASGISMPWIVNVTATFFTGVRFDLGQHAYMNPRWPGHYNTLRFRTLTTKVLGESRLAPCTASCKAYNVGLVSITNTRSPHQALASAHAYVRVLQRAGILDARVLNFKVDNIVAAGDLGFRVRLQCMVQSMANPSVIHYDPDTFPAAIYHEPALDSSGVAAPNDARIAVLVFASGKIICVGFRNLEQLAEVYIKINQVAQSFVCDVNDLANASGGMSDAQQMQSMSDVDQLMYELICTNAPDKAVALLTQPVAPSMGGGDVRAIGSSNDPALQALGFSELLESQAQAERERERALTTPPIMPLLGQLTHAGVSALHDAINAMSDAAINMPAARRAVLPRSGESGVPALLVGETTVSF